ncbi:hypothetical protein NNO_0211 [Hydrogenimonas sp.]|nr:hypothetical protein NNO_0211 [Hydrogenimonas sp.]
MKARGAFGLWQAIAVILVLGVIMTVTMRYAKIGALHTADSYTKEQAELFLRSAVEMALLQISAHDRSGGCLGSVKVVSRDGRFIADINITRYYLLENSADLALCGTLGYPIQSEESHGMVMIEAVVRSDPSNAKIVHPVRILRRSLQRP